MSKQEYDELWGVITDENEALNEILEELKSVFPDARIERDQVFGNVIVASLQAEDDVWLYANAKTGRYFVSVSYEKDKLRILLILKKYFDVTYDLSFIYYLMLSIKGMIKNYNRGKEIELYDAMVWINTFVAKEKRWKACEKYGKLVVCLRPYVLDDDYEGAYIDIYKAKGEITTPDLSIKFYPIRRKMRFIVDGTLTTKRFSSLIDIITSFEIG
ncbi:MAG: hypothetical protein QXJ23_09895 [Thermofilum sp.]|uniref:hypothetical protein n=1 Tax=Thermofilum sp. TaxID=1961369 RepID=UPI00317B85E4